MSVNSTVVKVQTMRKLSSLNNSQHQLVKAKRQSLNHLQQSYKMTTVAMKATLKRKVNGVKLPIAKQRNRQFPQRQSLRKRVTRLETYSQVRRKKLSNSHHLKIKWPNLTQKLNFSRCKIRCYKRCNKSYKSPQIELVSRWKSLK